MNKLMMSGNAIVRYRDEDDTVLFSDIYTPATLYLTEENYLLFIFKITFPEVKLDEVIQCYLWLSKDIKRQAWKPWNEDAVKIFEDELILEFNLYKNAQEGEDPCNCIVWARMKGEMPENIPKEFLIDLTE